MDIKELADLFGKSNSTTLNTRLSSIKELADLFGKSNRCKYIAWWNEDPDGMYRYDLFKPSEIADIEACVAAASAADLATPCGESKYTLFHMLVWYNFYNAVKGVLQKKVVKPDITDCGGNGVTALMLACNAANLQMVKLLFEYGASDRVTDSEGRNCFHYLTGIRVGLTKSFRSQEATYDQRAAIAEILQYGINEPNKENKTPLVSMLIREDRNISYTLIDAFIKKGADCGYVDEDGDTLLHIAVKNRHLTAALRLMTRENVNIANKAGDTPLKIAESRHIKGLCIALKDKGAVSDTPSARLDLRDLKQTTSNAYACGNEIDEIGIAIYLTEKIIKAVDTDDEDEVGYIADLLFNALSSDENCTILDMCVANKISLTQTFTTHGTVWCLRDKCLTVRAGINAIKKLAALGVDLNEPLVAGRTPANIVAGQSRPNLFGNEKCTYFEDSVKFFSTESMNVLNNDGASAVHLAAMNGHTEMLKAMIAAGADVNVTQDAPSDAGNTPLFIACFKGDSEAVKLLIANGADENVCNVKGETPAHTAFNETMKCGAYTCRRNDDENDFIATLSLLKNLDGQRNDGRTPLMQLQFCNLNFVAAVQYVFLDAGADVNKKDNAGNTALMLAAWEHSYKEPIKELVRAGADVNAANNRGMTALHCALKHGSQDVARYLIKKGADYNRADNDGVTPVQLAAERGYDAVLELMTDI